MICSDDDPPKRTKIGDLKWTFDDGDVLIRFPDSTLSFQVSSQILGLASPIFKKMFKKEGFMEGTMLKNRSRDEVVPLDLSKNSSRGMLVYCIILHHQYKDEPDLELLEDLGVLCEKYIYTNPFKNHVRYWLDLINFSTPCFPDRVQIATRLLVLSYHFGIENMFRETSSIILFCEEDIVENSYFKPKIPFPDEISDILR